VSASITIKLNVIFSTVQVITSRLDSITVRYFFKESIPELLILELSFSELLQQF